MDAQTTPPTHYVRPDVQGLLNFLAGLGAPEMHTLPLDEARESYKKLLPFAEAEPRQLAVIRDLACPGPAGEIPLRLYDARDTRAPGPAVLFFHGGGFVIGDLDSHHSLCTEIAAELDLPVIAVDYRLAPEHPFPAAPDDCEAAARWVAESPEALGREVTGLVPMGDSAGGNLTIVTTQALAARPAKAPVVVQVPIYPATDEPDSHPSYEDYAEGFLLTRASMAWFGREYAAEPGHPRAYPLRGDHAAAPPTVLVTASLDPLRDEGRAYGAELIRAGAEVVYLEMKGSVHGFTNLRKAIPSAQADVHAMFAAIRLLLSRPARATA